ncbi:N-acetylated-alpha-linked acidic dipeptidase-like protein [Elysia marginata]|uniref:N-acetylated-alpha-linked acidic dipeptidase-like protein n=1 Tax=Elysia marginata TaxID=1093978 RepID=A0AAV4ILZ3_9GAST|nr:N-acetylated-alpha-linked acidic dipeptidase-like protein [Elysia marginata]
MAFPYPPDICVLISSFKRWTATLGSHVGVRNCEEYGVRAVLLYWQEGDITFDVPEGLNSSSYVPYASAVDPAIDEPIMWQPSIPCQTVSAKQADELLSFAFDLSVNQSTNDLVMSPPQWQGSTRIPLVIGVREGNDASIELPKLRLSVYNVEKKRRVRNIISSIPSVEDPGSSQHTDGSRTPLSVTTQSEQVHHFKFHLAATRVLILAMLAVLDNRILPFDLLAGAQGRHGTIWQSSHALRECSQNKYRLTQAMKACEHLEAATKAFNELSRHFREKKDKTSLLSMNGVSMLHERLLMRSHRGRDRHLLYPLSPDGTIAVISELCQVGAITGDWNTTVQFQDTLTRVLDEMLLSLHMGA